MQIVGFLLVAITSTMMDSENLTIPLAIAAVGSVLIWRGSHAR